VKKLTELGNIVAPFDLLEGQDIRNREQIEKAVAGNDVVFHLAAIADVNQARVHPFDTMKTNVTGTRNVVDACWRNGLRLYFASTCGVYGNQEYHPTDEGALLNPTELYALSKRAGESIVKELRDLPGGTVMRFATVYGPGVKPSLGTHIFLGQALRGEPITVHGDGSQTRVMVYIDDVIDAIIALYNSGKMNDTWNVSSTEEISAQKMAEDIKRITGSRSVIIHTPQREGQTFREQISVSKIYKETGWKARVNWEEGLQKMFDWFVKTNQVENRYEMPK
jgi:nucleoside-diphosphate-sugar epimerase